MSVSFAAAANTYKLKQTKPTVITDSISCKKCYVMYLMTTFMKETFTFHVLTASRYRNAYKNNSFFILSFCDFEINPFVILILVLKYTHYT